MKNLTTKQLIEVFNAYEILKQQAKILGVPAFETKKLKGLMKAEAFEHYEAIVKEIMKREDKELFEIQSNILNALVG